MSMIAQRLVRPTQRMAVRLMSEQATPSTTNAAVDAASQSMRKMHRHCPSGKMTRYSPFRGLVFMGLGGGAAYSIYALSNRRNEQTQQTMVDMQSRLAALEQNNTIGRRFGSELSK